MASFNFKSGYHHVDIKPEYQKYLGFSWFINGVQTFFVFAVLPFGLNSAPFLFNKLFRPLIKHWGSPGNSSSSVPARWSHNRRYEGGMCPGGSSG